MGETLHNKNAYKAQTSIVRQCLLLAWSHLFKKGHNINVDHWDKSHCYKMVSYRSKAASPQTREVIQSLVFAGCADEK